MTLKPSKALDHVFKRTDDTKVYVRRNNAGQANLLKAVKRPLGGSFTLDYTRKGNKVDYSDRNQVIDMPHSLWVLSKVTLTDGIKKSSTEAKSTYVTSYDYDSGFYSRAEREFYGFHTVTETRGSGSEAVSVVQAYENQSYHKKGLLVTAVTSDHQGKAYVAAENQYGMKDGATSESKFPYLTKTITSFYNVAAQTVAKTTSQEYTSYDSYGNITDVRGPRRRRRHGRRLRLHPLRPVQ